MRGPFASLILRCVTIGLMFAAAIPMVFLVNSTPDRIPADVTVDEIEAVQRQEEQFAEKDKAVAEARVV